MLKIANMKETYTCCSPCLSLARNPPIQRTTNRVQPRALVPTLVVSLPHVCVFAKGTGLSPLARTCSKIWTFLKRLHIWAHHLPNLRPFTSETSILKLAGILPETWPSSVRVTTRVFPPRWAQVSLQRRPAKMITQPTIPVISFNINSAKKKLVTVRIMETNGTWFYWEHLCWSHLLKQLEECHIFYVLVCSIFNKICDRTSARRSSMLDGQTHPRTDCG